MSDYDWHWYTGPRLYSARINDRTEAALIEAIRLFHEKYPNVPVYVTQGAMFGHGGGAVASAGVHDGTSALDLSTRGMTRTQALYLVRCMRRVGFAAWLRLFLAGVWPEHIHALLIGSKGLPRLAVNQVKSYLAGRTGLVGNAVDHLNGAVFNTTWEKYKKAHPIKPPAPADPKGLFDMGQPVLTERKIGQGLKANRDTMLQVNDKGFTSVVYGKTPSFQTKITLRIDGLPADGQVSVRCSQVDVDSKGNATEALFGGVDKQTLPVSPDGTFRRSFIFDGAVKAGPKGKQRRVRPIVTASHDCKITYCSTLTRKES